MNLKFITFEVLGWIYFAQEMFLSLAIVNREINFVFIKAEKYLD